MKNIKIGILCPSEIAFRRFMPALKKVSQMIYAGIAVANEFEWFGNTSSLNDLTILNAEKKKAQKFKDKYGGKIYSSYLEMIESDDIDAVYIPLPPALHHKWAKIALENNKHVFVEKPSTTSYADTLDLVQLAQSRHLALHENYMFNFHSQLDHIEDLINRKVVGDVRLYRISFGFPFRGTNDFRYNKILGGGALLDCGGYTIKLATRLLGESSRLVHHQLNYVDGFDVDIFGSGVLVNDDKQVAQISFGMDNSYKCELEVWGEKGVIFTNRVLTAPDGFKPTISITTQDGTKNYEIDSDDSFKKSIEYFAECVFDEERRIRTYDALLKQEKMVDIFKEDI